jgi:hypothetical protein
MRSLVRVCLTVGALSLGLLAAGCEDFDPTAIFDSEMFNTKKKLPGERRPVFPEGTPGVSQGVPPELIKGYQAPAEPEAAAKEVSAPGAVQPKETSSQPAQSPESAPTRQAPVASGWPASPQPSGGVAWPDPPAPR